MGRMFSFIASTDYRNPLITAYNDLMSHPMVKQKPAEWGQQHKGL
jgi:hypothetical protein